MAQCVACEGDIDEGEEVAPEGCPEQHPMHQDCVDQNLEQGFPCQGCDPPEDLPAPAYEQQPVEPVVPTPDPVGPAGTYGEPVGEPVAQPAATADPEPAVVVHTGTDAETEAGTAAVAPTAEGATAGPAPTQTLDEKQAAAAERLGQAIARADAAVRAAEGSITALTGAGANRAAVLAAVDAEAVGFGGALAVCATTGDWSYTAEHAAEWPATDQVIADCDGASTSFEGNAAAVEAGAAALARMAAVDVGAGVILGGVRQHNVVDMALGGPSWQGNNLHDLTRELAGWSSIRGEGGEVAIVRWAGTKLQVGATGKHIQTSNGYDYKLDKSPASSFTTRLACRRADGSHELV